MIPFVAHQVPCIGVFIPYIFGIVSSGALLFLIKLFHTFAGIMALSLGFGFLFASFGCLGPQTLLEVVGEDFLSTGFGYTLVPVALGSLMGASTAGTSRLAPKSHFRFRCMLYQPPSLPGCLILIINRTCSHGTQPSGMSNILTGRVLMAPSLWGCLIHLQDVFL